MAALKISVSGGRPAAGGKSLIVALQGELDVATAPPLTARFDELLSDPHGQIVVDVSRLAFVDAAGLRVLASLRGRGRQQQVAVRLSGVSSRMRRLARILGPAGDLG